MLEVVSRPQKLLRCSSHSKAAFLIIFLVVLLVHLGVYELKVRNMIRDIGPVEIGTFFAALSQGEGVHAYTGDTVVNVEWSEDIANERRMEYKRRLRKLSEGCEILKKMRAFRPDISLTERQTLWDSENNLIWCPVLKAGSTTWMQNFGYLHFNNGTLPHIRKKLRGKSSKVRQPRVKQQKKQLIKKALKFFIVRHPFERILSAYRDKMLREDSHTAEWWRRLQIEVSTKYNFPSETKEHQYLIRSVINGTEWIHPKFQQFLLKVRDDMQRLWAGKGDFEVNGHWQPYWISCAPCQRQYDIIVKVETIDLDNEYIIRTAGLQGKLNNTHAHSSRYDNFTKSSDAIQHYFSQVPLWLLKDLFQLYKPDFTLFGYQPDYLFGLAKDV